MESAEEVLWQIPRHLALDLNLISSGCGNKKREHGEYYWDLESSWMGVKQKHKHTLELIYSCTT